MSLSLQVLFVDHSIAIVEGLNNDAEVGTALAFTGGKKGCDLAKSRSFK